MKIYESAVRKPVSTILIFVGVMVMGLFSLRNLAVDMYPDIEMPAISVITTYQGANAADIETNVTRVLEDNLNTVNNLKEITSSSKDNISMIILEFEWGADLTEAANDIRDVIGRVQTLLPDEVDAPTIFKFSSSMIPIMMFSATADESYEVKTYGYNMRTGEETEISFGNYFNGYAHAMMVWGQTPHGLLVTEEIKYITVNATGTGGEPYVHETAYDVYALIDLDDFVHSRPNFRTIAPVPYANPLM